MELLTFILLTIASFSGTLFAIIISQICIEEINDISNYVFRIIPILISAMMFILISENNIIFAVISTIIIFSILRLLNGMYNHKILYISSGFLLYLSTLTSKSLEIGVIIFIYGMLIATVDASNIFQTNKSLKIKRSQGTKLFKTIISKYSYFIAVSIIFYTFFEYILKI